MINRYDAIRYQRIVSQKLVIEFNALQDALTAIADEIQEAGASLTGKYFYTLEDIQNETDAHIEVFFQVEENDITFPPSMSYHSYYSIESMVSMYVHGELFGNIAAVYATLYDYIEQNQLKEVTAIFHEIGGTQEFPYMHVKIGVTEIDEEDIWK